MCGIAGFWDARAAEGEEELLRRIREMNASIAHRGPDGEGVHVDAKAGLALGHRRLAIIDLSPNGRQPMFSASGLTVVVFNGEIYNFAGLRGQLEREGCTFRGHSDTEVLVEACERWGVESTLPRLVGMFAFALWDGTRQRLILARDRLGKKPLYYHQNGSLLLFASQVKALRCHPAFRPRLDAVALHHFLRLSYVPASGCIYQGVRQLPPGHWAEIDRDGALRLGRYWDPWQVVREGQSGRQRAEEDSASDLDRLEALLQEAVSDRMVTDVPLGAFLSGGIDSSLVTALMQRHSSQRVRTFSIGFQEGRYDEADAARAVARHLGTDHTELYVDARQAMEIIPQLPAFYDEPFADSSQVPTLLLSKLTREHVTVALSGDGGDELFGGYNRHVLAARLERLFRQVPPVLRHLAAGILRGLSPGIWDGLGRLIPPGKRPRLLGDKLHKLGDILALPDQAAIYPRLVAAWPWDRPLVKGVDCRRETWPPGGLPDPPEGLRFSEIMQLYDLVTYLPEDILVKVDRASMAVGLETRAPFLDHRVVAWSWQLPMSRKVVEGQGKWLLRQVLYRHVPPTLVNRPKMGFALPVDGWLRGPLRGWCEDLMRDLDGELAGLLEGEPWRERFREHVAGVRNWQISLWNLFMFLSWRRYWKV
ncbi:MAG: asparagine synthase (glutamine-hydrolyzing) [Magnetococcales bacterium]|nr:asparagine synthase (glutamine-hydrolyzing) [Magnetococcales bacterium]